MFQVIQTDSVLSYKFYDTSSDEKVSKPVIKEDKTIKLSFWNSRFHRVTKKKLITKSTLRLSLNSSFFIISFWQCTGALHPSHVNFFLRDSSGTRRGQIGLWEDVKIDFCNILIFIRISDIKRWILLCARFIWRILRC